MNGNQALVRDLGILVARLGIGAILIAHGWQKIFDWGLPMTAEIMGQGGVPLPTLIAYFTGFAELLGGTGLVVGAAVRLAAAAGTLVMTGAFVFVQNSASIFMEDDGFGFVLAIAATCLMLAATGSGRFGIDHYVTRHYLERHRTEQSA